MAFVRFDIHHKEGEIELLSELDEGESRANDSRPIKIGERREKQPMLLQRIPGDRLIDGISTSFSLT